MQFLTKPIGRFPLGIWIVVVLLFVSGGIFTLFGQALSLLSWDSAISLGLQEDSPRSADTVERMMVAVSWGEAGADVIVQGSLIVLTLAGIFLRRRFGYIAGIGQSIIWVYVALLVSLQRMALYKWDLVSDLSRARHVAPLMFLFAAIPGTIMLLCLISNRRFFEESRGSVMS